MKAITVLVVCLATVASTAADTQLFGAGRRMLAPGLASCDGGLCKTTGAVTSAGAAAACATLGSPLFKINANDRKAVVKFLTETVGINVGVWVASAPGYRTPQPGLAFRSVDGSGLGAAGVEGANVELAALCGPGLFGSTPAPTPDPALACPLLKLDYPGVAVQGKSAYLDFVPKDKTPLRSRGPYAIAHRGSSGELPEHTAEDYKQAIALGADFVECDTVLTKDGHLICRHEPNLSNTTNADELFPELIKTYIIDFAPSTGVHAIDLTLAQVKQLRARQRVFFRDQSYNDLFHIISLEEHLEVLLGANRVVGAYPETKHPTWHDAFKLPALIGKSMSDKLLEVLTAYGYAGKINSPQWLRQPVFIQSFETSNLKDLKTKTELPLVQLTSGLTSFVPDLGNGTCTPFGGCTPNLRYSSLLDGPGLTAVSKYAAGLGPDKYTVTPRINQTVTVPPAGTDIVSRAHALGMQVHPYTFRNEPVFFATDSFKTVFDEYKLFTETLGVDGTFSDYVEAYVTYLRLARERGATFPTLYGSN